MSFDFFGTRIRIGALPRLPGSCGLVRIFLFFGIWDGAGFVVRMGAELRFARFCGSERIGAARSVVLAPS